MIQDVINILSTLDGPQFFSLFWFWLLIDVPRYLLSLVPVIFALVVRRGKIWPTLERGDRHAGVSFLLAGHNEETVLAETVRSIREQTIESIEIIVIDDGSTDQTAAVARRLLEAGEIDQFFMTDMRAGRAAALNLGLGHCRYEIVAYGDTDTTYDRDAFANFLPYFDDPEVGGVSCNLDIKNDADSVWTRLQSLEFLESISIGRRFLDLMGILPIISGGFGAFRKSALLSLGGWEAGTGEDADMTEKLRRAGWRIRFSPHSWGLTSGPADLFSLIRQRLRWERDVVRLRVRKYRSNISPFWPRFIVSNTISNWDILIFQMIIPALFVFYIVYMFMSYGQTAIAILIIVNIIYFLEDLFNYTALVILHPERNPLRLLLYLPFLSVYQWFLLRILRLSAYLDEMIFRRSLVDTFVPRRVSRTIEDF